MAHILIFWCTSASLGLYDGGSSPDAPAEVQQALLPVRVLYSAAEVAMMTSSMTCIATV